MLLPNYVQLVLFKDRYHKFFFFFKKGKNRSPFSLIENNFPTSYFPKHKIKYISFQKHR